jgi:hypothetical protein
MPVDLAVDRCILLRDGASLEELHHTIQAAMGWHDSHLHEFMVEDRTRYGDPNMSGYGTVVDESRVKTKELLRNRGDSHTYTYDFGDHWIHRIELVSIREGRGRGSRESTCLGGKGACPPEDCGGVFGYLHLIEVLADPIHEEHEELRGWVDGMDRYPLDPTAFDLQRTHLAVRRV